MYICGSARGIYEVAEAGLGNVQTQDLAFRAVALTPGRPRFMGHPNVDTKMENKPLYPLHTHETIEGQPPVFHPERRHQQQ